MPNGCAEPRLLVYYLNKLAARKFWLQSSKVKVINYIWTIKAGQSGEKAKVMPDQGR